MKRHLKDYLLITFKGIGMGAADVIPGVSGGTIAFITGIYEELITGISNINGAAVKKLFKEGPKSFWRHINGNFFAALILGIAISAFTLARLVTYLLAAHPVLLWSFFFGLIVGSSQLILKTVKTWNLKTIIGLLAGIGIAAYISLLHVTAAGGNLWYVFLSGAVGICAMILPGISGAFILVLMGSYGMIMEGINNFNIALVCVFATGCVVGILSFSRLLKYLFNNHRELVLAILSGFLVGSLLKIWPWKNRIGEAPIIVHANGQEDWMMQNVLPHHFEGTPYIGYALLLAVLGYLVVYVLAKFAPPEEA